jgi:hypothetical protein
MNKGDRNKHAQLKNVYTNLTSDLPKLYASVPQTR